MLGISTLNAEAVRWDSSQNQINTADILPSVDSAQDIGSTLKRWSNLWIDDLTATAAVNIGGALNHDGLTAGFYATAPIAKQVGVAVSAAGVHAALVNLGLIAA